MNTVDKVAVCSRSFSKNNKLRKELLKRYAHVKFNDMDKSLDGVELIKFLEGHNKAITALERINDEILDQLPELKVIGKYGVGLDMIDLNSLKKHGVRLGWTGGVNKRSVSELVITLAVSLLRHVTTANREVQTGEWRQHVGGYLTARTVGIIGCGHIGKDLIHLLHPWNCTILAHDILEFPEFYANNNVKAVELDFLLKESDIVTLHLPLTNLTENILSSEKLALLKQSAILINTARGGLLDEKALKKLLISKQIAAAAMDVFKEEPPKDSELLSLPNFLATPHIGGSSYEAIMAMGMSAIEGLDLHEAI
jgi:phosphoglycerate dehydrogenase-like enzyme